MTDSHTKSPLIAAVDAGTGGVRCVLFDLTGASAGQAYVELQTLYPAPGRAEQDPDALLEASFAAVRGALRDGGVPPEAVAAVTFATTQTTFVPVDGAGRCLGNLILWQDARGAERFAWIRRRLAERGLDEMDLYRRCGRPLDAILGGAKVLWLREHCPSLWARADRFVTPQALLARAFGAQEWVTDACDGAWWLVHDAVTLAPDPLLEDLFALTHSRFPRLAAPGTPIGAVSRGAAAKTGLKKGTPILLGAADQQCAALGAGNDGTDAIGNLCLGTAGIAMLHTAAPTFDPGGRMYLLGYPAGGYALEAAVPACASAFRWVRDVLYPAELCPAEGVYDRMTAAAGIVPAGANGVVFLPHLAGGVFPVDAPQLRGAFAGLSAATGRADLTRAAMEGVCFEMRDLLEGCRAAGGARFERLRVLGGATRSALWNQMQADVYRCPVETVEAREASALGAAIVAAVGLGLHPDWHTACREMTRLSRRYEPDPESAERYEAVYAHYRRLRDDLAHGVYADMAAGR